MPDLYYPYGDFFVLNGIDDSSATLAYAISFLTSQLLTARRPWILRQQLNAIGDLLEIFFGNPTEVVLDGLFEEGLIYGHLFSAS
jgi:hypothetical protein